MFEFENVGKKIQRLSKILFFLFLIVGGLTFCVSLYIFFININNLEFATINGGAFFESLEESGNTAYLALNIMKISSFAAILGPIGSLAFYGFGIVVENAENSLLTYKDKSVSSEEKQ